MRIDRRTCMILLGMAALAPTSAGAATSSPEWVTDAIGRRVSPKKPVRRIVLLDALDMVSMAVVQPDPSQLVIGWAGVDKFDSDLVRRQFEMRTDGGTIPIVGGQTADTVSVERILALEPDLVVTTAYMEPNLGEGHLTRRIEAAGIPVIFSNAASNRRSGQGSGGDPFADMFRTQRLWGSILGKGEAAEAFIAFIQARLAEVAQRLEGAVPVKTYLEVQSTYDDCCWAAGQHIWGDLLTRAGGCNLSAVEASWYAKVAPEQLMVEAPSVYIASGGAFGTGIRPGIGPGLDPAKARDGLRRLITRTGLATLPAVRDGRVHGVWSGLLSIPSFNVLFVEIAAKWLHPERFKDVDPSGTLTEIGRRFLTQPLPGPCWLSLDATPQAPAR